MTPMWSRPLYQGLIPATYCSRNRRCRSVIMESPLALSEQVTDILGVYQAFCQGFAVPPPVPPPERKKRTIQEIRDSKTTGEKMVYMSVPDYTSAKWAEMAGVDVAVVGDSLAMIAHGHPNTIPATMDMMAMHAAAIRRGAPNTFVLGCMPYQSYNTVDRALTNATRFMQEAALRRGQAARRQVAGAHPEGAGRRRHPDRLAHRPDAAHRGHVRRLPDPGQDRRRGDEDPGGRARDPGRRLLHARVRGGAGEDRRGDLEAARDSRPSASAPASAPTARSCSATTCSASSPTSSRSSPSASPTSPRSR